jgi:hypothetical protein
MTVAKTSHTRSEGVDTQDAQVSDSGSETKGAARERSNAVWFDPWLICTHQLVVGYAEALTERYARDPTRQRRLKVADRENLRAMLHALLSNLAYAVVLAGKPPSPLIFGPVPPSVLISLRTMKQKQKRRYGRPEGFAGLPAALDRLIRRPLVGDLFSLEKSHTKGEASRIVVGPLAWEVAHGQIGPADFSYAEGYETIWLSKVAHDYIDGTIDREWIDYKDTPETIRYRAEMGRINAFLAEADVRMEPSDSGSGNGSGGPPVVTFMRPLRRLFSQPLKQSIGGDDTPRFDRSGRLYGGWGWQTLPRSQRHLIRIDGEPIAELDFASMLLRLAYLRAGIEPPEGDLYTMVQGAPPKPRATAGEIPPFEGFEFKISDSIPIPIKQSAGLRASALDDLRVLAEDRERWRDGVKKICSAMLFRTGPLTRLPPNIRPLLPSRIRAATIREAVLAAHPALASVFETGVGLQLMFTESQILVSTLLRLIDHGIPALPLHDGLLVARSKAGAAMEAMAAASEEIVGTRLPITLK